MMRDWMPALLVGYAMGFLSGATVLDSCASSSCGQACIEAGHDGGHQKAHVCACVDKEWSPYLGERSKGKM